MARHVCKHRKKIVFLNLIRYFFARDFNFLWKEERISHMFQNDLMFCHKYNARLLMSKFLYIFEPFLVVRQCERICL